MRYPRLLLLVGPMLLAACSNPVSGVPDDAATPDVGADAETRDATASDGNGDGSALDLPDAEADAGPDQSDAAPVDTPVVDTPVADAPVADAPLLDTPLLDVPVTDGVARDTPASDIGMEDTSATDAPRDMGLLDAGPMDTGPLDAGPRDGGPLDSVVVDVVPRDTETVDADALDAGVPDAAPGDSGVTDECRHECPAWGAVCAGDVLQTCFYNTSNCRRLMTQTCALGCVSGACRTCSTYADPVVGRALNDLTGYYQDISVTGGVALATWSRRNPPTGGARIGVSAVGVTDPRAMVVRGVTTLATSGSMGNFQRVGDRAYFLNSAGLQIYDVSNPAMPTRLGTFTVPTSAGVVYGVSVSGTTACLAAANGLHLVDVASATSPVEVGLYAGVAPVRQVRCVPGRAAVAGVVALHVVNTADPARPTLVSQASVTNVPYGDNTIQFDGTTVFLTSAAIYDSGSASGFWYAVESFGARGATPLARLGTLGYMTRIHATQLVAGNLYVGLGDGVGQIDVSNPSAMRWREHVHAAEYGAGVAFDQGILYATGNGVDAYDLTRAPDVTLLPVPTDDYLAGSALVGSIGYLARSQRGLVIEDLRDPTAPVILSATPLNPVGFGMIGRYAYAAVRPTGGPQLQVYDVGEPARPRLVSSVNVTGGGSAFVDQLYLSNGRAYTLCGLGRVCVFDVRDPARPTQIVASDVIGRVGGSASTSASVFAVDGNLVVIPNIRGVFVADMTDPLAPVSVGAFPAPSMTYNDGRLTVSGHRAYVVQSCGGNRYTECITVVDLSDPARPTVMGRATHVIRYLQNLYPVLNLSTIVTAVRVDGGRMFVSHRWGGVTMFDVSDPAAIRVINDYWTTLPAKGMFVIDRFLQTFTSGDFYYPAPAASTDQLVRLCP